MKILIINQSGLNDYYIEDTIRLFYENENIIRSQTDVSSLTESFDVIKVMQDQVTFNSGVSEVSSRLNTNPKDTKDYKWDIKRTIYLILSKHFKISRPWGISTGIRPSKIVHELLEQGFSNERIMKHLMEYYLLSEEKAEILIEVANAERIILNGNMEKDVSIYVGIPYCPSICHYCSFSSYPIDAKTAKPDEYVESLCQEAKALAELIETKGERVKTIYVGGGTPTSLSISQLRRLLQCISTLFVSEDLTEFTVEAGRPDTIDEEKLKLLREHNVSRISINPQTLKEETLELVGRKHTVQQFFEAFKTARSLGFNNINVDLIAGLPDECIADFEHSLKEIIKLDPENITIHALAKKRASKMNQLKQNYTLPNEDLSVTMSMVANVLLKEADYIPYYLYRQKNISGHQENIGFCKPGKYCVYNVQIMEERQTIYAIGAGGVTKLFFSDENRVERTFNVKAPNEYNLRINEMILRKLIANKVKK